MKYYYNLYVNDSIRENKFRILNRINRGEFVINKYLIVLTKNENNHLEIFDSAFVSQKVVEKEELFIIGLADGYSGALKIVEMIVHEVLQMTGGTNIRKYLLEQQLEFEKRNG